MKIGRIQAFMISAFLVLGIIVSITPRASAEVVIYRDFGANNQPNIVTEWFGYVNTTSGLPRVAKDGVPALSSAITWTGADPTIATPSYQNGAHRVTGYRVGNTIFTATYQGESANVTMKIRYGSRFTGPPSRTGIPPLLPGLPGITTGVNSEPLVGYDPISGQTVALAGRTVTFYDYNGSTTPICSAITGSDGRASCSTQKLNLNDTYKQLDVEFASDDTYGPAIAQIFN